MSNLLLIDGNNLAFRVHHANPHLSHEGRPVSLLYGFFRSLISLKKRYSDYECVIAWDAFGSQRRIRESEEAFKSGITTMPYKGSKIAPDYEDAVIEKECDPFFESLWEQMDDLREALNHTNCMQVQKKNFEADDLIYTYVNRNKAAGGKTICVSSDQDYYQMIGDGCKIYDAMKQVMWDEAEFYREFKFPLSSYVDYGALAGDSSDRIISPDGWAKGTAKKYIQEYETIDNIVNALKKKEEDYENLEAQYNQYMETKDKSIKVLKKDLNALKLKKVEANLLNQIPRLRLGQSLKQMDRVLLAPKISCPPGNYRKLREFFIKNGFITLMNQTERLVSRDTFNV